MIREIQNLKVSTHTEGNGLGKIMEISLNVKDRLTLIAILPTTGRMTDLVEVLELIKLLRFTEEEKQEIGYKEADGKILWDISKEKPRSIDINFEQLRIVKDKIKELDEGGKIDLNTLDTCLKFSKL